MSSHISAKDFERIMARRSPGTRLTVIEGGDAEAAARTPFGRRTGKFNAKRIETDDGVFHSTGEYHRWLDLKTLERAGLVRDLKRQVKYPLEGKDGPLTITDKRGRLIPICYVADFVYFDAAADAWTVEDFKGHDTKDSKLKRIILRAMLPKTTRIVVTRAA